MFAGNNSAGNLSYDFKPFGSLSVGTSIWNLVWSVGSSRSPLDPAGAFALDFSRRSEVRREAFTVLIKESEPTVTVKPSKCSTEDG